LYENLWAIPFATALRRVGAELVAGGRVPVRALIDSLDAADSSTRPSTHDSAPLALDPDKERTTMPGLLRGIARTAVVAGTATAVSNRVSRRQAGRWARQDQQQYVEQEPPPAEPQPASDMDAKLAQLKQLGELKSQGVLSEAEFEQQKSRILNA